MTNLIDKIYTSSGQLTINETVSTYLLPQYNIGGKTGTASPVENGQYNTEKNIASFISFLPINDPKYAIFILLDNRNYTFFLAVFLAFCFLLGSIFGFSSFSLAALPRKSLRKYSFA